MLIDPPWTSSQAETVLLDWVLHEAGPRGNGWSSCRAKLYGVRHKHVLMGFGDVLKHKPRLWQFMSSLKKIKPPGESKHPVTVAMLRVIRDMLDLTTLEGKLTWAAVCAGFHFMMRSAEYLATLTGGRFDLDRVLRVGDVTFFRNGRRTTDLLRADEVRLVLNFGKQKASRGGETRSIFACESDLCVVRALAHLLMHVSCVDKHKPLFAWPSTVNRPGCGLRYCDMLALLKLAAKKCGRDVSQFGTHSLRRGGGCAYLASGSTLQQVTYHGRWAPDSKAVHAYVEDGAGRLLASHQARVLDGGIRTAVLDRQPPRPRLVREFEISRALRKEFGTHSL